MGVKERKQLSASSQKALNYLIEGRPYIILAVLLVIFTIIAPDFINPINLLNMIKRQAYVAVVAFSCTFIVTLAALDLSPGSISALVGVSFALLLSRSPLAALPAPLALTLSILVALLIGAACGFINGFISVKGRIIPFLVTLATMNIFRSLAIVLSGSKEITISNATFNTMFATGKVFGVIPTPVIIVVIMFVIAWYLLEKTKFGYYVKAVGGNEEAAIVSGINVGLIKMCAYTMHGAFAALAGLMIAGLYSSGSPSAGMELYIDAIAGVILGGTAIRGGNGKIWGTLAGVLILAVIINGMTMMGAMYDVQILVKGIVIILAVLLDNFITRHKK